MNRHLNYFSIFLAVLIFVVWKMPVAATAGVREPLCTLPLTCDQGAAEPSQWDRFLPESYEALLSSAIIAEKTSKPGRGYNWEGPAPECPDWRGIKIDTAYYMAYQFLAIGIIYIAPESFSGWSKEDKEDYSLSKWWENITNPIWDDDQWYVNYILHPYWGATFYTRARERGLKRVHSFWYAFLLSTLYEFGAEALFEPVSYQDLVVTPIAGALLGEYVFSPIRDWARARPGEPGLQEKALLLVTDPIGVANETLNMIFGVGSEIRFCLLGMESMAAPPGLSQETGSGAQGGGGSMTTWGLQFKINW